MPITTLRTYIWLESWRKSEFAALIEGKTRNKYISSAIESVIDKVTEDCKDVFNPKYQGSFPKACDVLLTKHMFKILEKGGVREKLAEYTGLTQYDVANKPIRLRSQSAELIRWWCRNNQIVIHRAVNLILHDELNKCPVNLHGFWPVNWLQRKKDGFTLTVEEEKDWDEMLAQIETHRKDHV